MVFSAIEFQTRLEIQDLLNRFCHSLEHCDLAAWQGLFTRNAMFTSSQLGQFSDLHEIRLIPDIVRDLGGGAWRFQLFNLILTPGSRRSSIIARSCLAILDCEQDNIPRRVSDCVFEIRHATWWQIARFEGQSVQKQSPKAAKGASWP